MINAAKIRKAALPVSLAITAVCLLMLIPHMRALVIGFAEVSVMRRPLDHEIWMKFILTKALQAIFVLSCMTLLFGDGKTGLPRFFVCLACIVSFGANIVCGIKNFKPQPEYRIRELEILSEQVKPGAPIGSILDNNTGTDSTGDFYRLQYVFSPGKIIPGNMEAEYIVGYSRDTEIPGWRTVMETDNFRLYAKGED